MKILHFFRNSSGTERVLYPFTKEDHTNLTEVFVPLKNEGHLDFKNLYKISDKEEDSEYGSEIELSN